jgi:hypothetical protein
MRRAIVAVVASLVGMTATTASSAAPRLIVVDGGGLSRPIVLADWFENGTLLSQWKLAQPARHPQLRCRPAFRLYFLWGPEWNDYVASRKPLHAIRPSEAGFHGRFWPA